MPRSSEQDDTGPSAEPLKVAVEALAASSPYPWLSNLVLRASLDFACPAQRTETREPGDVIALFKRHGLTPDWLRALFGESESVKARVEAVVFSACIYPRKARKPRRQDVELRVEAFRKNAAFLKDDPVGLVHSLLEEGSADEVRRFLLDLCWAKPETGGECTEARDSRIRAAACYVATCVPDDVKRMRVFWRDEREAVQLFRETLAGLPSRAARPGSGGASPNWSAVEMGLRSLYPAFSAGSLKEVISLERFLRSRARGWNLGAYSEEVFEHCWEYHVDKLRSGFAHFAFQSKLSTWWYPCLRSYQGRLPGVLGALQGDTGAAVRGEAKGTDKAEPIRVDGGHLRMLREGYRLVRSSFVAAPRKKDGTKSRCHLNEATRRIVDDLWRLCVLNPEREGGASQAEIARLYEVKESHVNQLSRRLRLRFLAYTWARFRQWNNRQIQYGPCPPTLQRKGSTPHPLCGEPGWRPVSCLARSVPKEQSLLPALTARLFLHSLVDKEHPDPWDFPRYVRELWWWVNRELMGAVEDVVRRFRETALCALIEELAGIESADELERQLARRSLARAESASRRIVEEATGALGWTGLFTEHREAWKAQAEWVVPLWYLAAVERLGPEECVARAKPAEEEGGVVLALAEEMASEVSQARVSGRSPKVECP